MRIPVLASILAIIVTVANAAEVNVYSYRQPELVKPLFDRFTEASGIEVNTTFLSKGLVERLQAEADRTPADLVMTVDISRLSAIVDAGLTRPVSSAALESAVPAEFRGKDGHWYALTLRARIVYASRDRVADGELNSYEDLADPKWKGRICTRSGTHPYNLALLSSMIAHHGEDAAKTWLEGLKSNLARRPQGNDRAQVKAIWAGECDISLGNTYYMGKMLDDEEQRQWADSVRILFPEFEGGATHMNVSGVAMTRHAPNPENALALLEFLVSTSGQELYASANHEYPVDPEVPASALVSSWGSFERDSLPLQRIAELRATALRLVEEVDFDG